MYRGGPYQASKLDSGNLDNILADLESNQRSDEDDVNFFFKSVIDEEEDEEGRTVSLG